MFVKQAFSQRRKTIFNNLKPLFEEREQLMIFLQTNGIKINQRAEQLAIEKYVDLANLFAEIKENNEV